MRRERGEVSIQECAWASLALTEPGWLGGNPWQREAGEPRSTPPSLFLAVSPTLVSVSSFQSARLCLMQSGHSQPVCHKNIIQPGRHSYGERGLCHTGRAWKTAEPTSPHFCCCWQSALRKPFRWQVRKAIHSDSSAINTQSEEGVLWSRELTTVWGSTPARWLFSNTEMLTDQLQVWPYQTLSSAHWSGGLCVVLLK